MGTVADAYDKAMAEDFFLTLRASRSRTTRSYTSGENLLCLFMAPFSQRWEPPQNQGRFRMIHRSKVSDCKNRLLWADHSPDGRFFGGITTATAF